jgi:hypothetical protein
MNQLKISGKITILSDEGKILYEKNNMVVNAGLLWLCDRMKNNSQSFLDYIAVGTDATAVTAADTTLGTEVIRKQATSKTSSIGTYMMETLISGSEAQGTWREAAMFPDASGGTMFNRVIINFVKGEKNVTLRFTITITNV